MKRLVAIFAAGALVLAVAPTVFAASGDPLPNNSPTSTLNFTMTNGTTITVPASWTIASAYPGQLNKVSASQQVTWVSNESAADLTVSLSDGSAAQLTSGGNHIAGTYIETWAGTFEAETQKGTNLGSKTIIASVTGDGSTYVYFKMPVVPTKPTGTYSGTLTFATQVAP